MIRWTEKEPYFTIKIWNFFVKKKKEWRAKKKKPTNLQNRDFSSQVFKGNDTFYIAVLLS